MIETRINLHNECCGNCGSDFTEGEMVLMSFLEENCYCENCTNGILSEASSNGYLEEFNQYLLNNGVGKLAINSFNILDCIDDGIYELLKINGKAVIESRHQENVKSEEYFKAISEESFLLERRGKSLIVIIQQNSFMDIYDYKEFKNQHKDIIHDIQMSSDASEVEFICNENDDIVGIASIRVNSSKQDIIVNLSDFTLLNLGMKMKNLLELRMEQRNIPINKQIARVLKKIIPKDILKYCESRIRGQGMELKKVVYLIIKYLECVANAQPFKADNWILTAPSGSGKAEFYRAISDFFMTHNIPIPVVQIDLSQITETGFKGADIDSIPKRILEEYPNSNGIGICFLDEADKKCVRNYDSKGVNINSAVQANLLTLIQGSKITVEVGDEKKLFDSNQTMFVLMGAFQELRNSKKKEKMKTNRLGFGASFDEPQDSEENDEFYDDLTLDEIISFGMIEELVGRMIQVVNFHKLSKKDMFELIKCKVKEISREFSVDIEITNKATEEFLDISFGNLGIRCPMNRIKELTNEKLAEICFDRRFNSKKEKIVITSLNSATIKCKVLAQHESD